MASFTDLAGRSWDVRITLGLLPKLREAGYDLTAVAKDQQSLTCLYDVETFGRVAWTLCAKQAAERDLDEDGFRDGFDGPTVFAAINAIVEATADFTQPPEVASAVKRRLPATMKRAMSNAAIKVEVEMARMEREMLEPTTLSGSTDTGGNSPASPESTAAT